jgi:hypothetical protein
MTEASHHCNTPSGCSQPGYRQISGPCVNKIKGMFQLITLRDTAEVVHLIFEHQGRLRSRKNRKQNEEYTQNPPHETIISQPYTLTSTHVAVMHESAYYERKTAGRKSCRKNST